MRKGFERLHGLVGERLREDVRSGTLFVFTNNARAADPILTIKSKVGF